MKISIYYTLLLLLSGAKCSDDDGKKYLMMLHISAKTTTSFDVKVAPKFGLDRNGNGIIDMPNSASYVNEQMDVEISAPFIKDTGIIRNYQWEVVNTATLQKFTFTTDRPVVTLALDSGEFSILAIRNRKYSPNQFVLDTLGGKTKIDDIVIVSLGDSYSSGEGAPEVQYCVVSAGSRMIKRCFDCENNCDEYVENGALSSIWGDDGSPIPENAPDYTDPDGIRMFNHADNSVNRSHLRAHRSSYSWPARVALHIENYDDLSAVKFISLAYSGAIIDSIIKFQLSELRAIVGAKKIDYILLSAGGNDAGFASLIQAFLMSGEYAVTAETLASQFTGSGAGISALINNFLEQDELRINDLNKIYRCINTGQWSSIGTISGLPTNIQSCPGMDGLSDCYYRLNQAIRSISSAANSKIYIITYPLPVFKGRLPGEEYCSSIGGWAADYQISQVIRSTGIRGFVNPNLASDLASLAFNCEMDIIEFNRAHIMFINPLNAKLEAAAKRFGWVPVRGLPKQTRFAGVCAPKPYEEREYNSRKNDTDIPNNDNRYFRTGHESVLIQGSIFGMLHPNEICYRFIADNVSETMEMPFGTLAKGGFYKSASRCVDSETPKLYISNGEYPLVLHGPRDKYLMTYTNKRRHCFKFEILNRPANSCRYSNLNNPLIQIFKHDFHNDKYKLVFSTLEKSFTYLFNDMLSPGSEGSYIIGISSDGNDSYNPLEKGPNNYGRNEEACFGLKIQKLPNMQVVPTVGDSL